MPNAGVAVVMATLGSTGGMWEIKMGLLDDVIIFQGPLSTLISSPATLTLQLLVETRRNYVAVKAAPHAPSAGKRVDSPQRCFNASAGRDVHVCRYRAVDVALDFSVRTALRPWGQKRAGGERGRGNASQGGIAAAINNNERLRWLAGCQALAKGRERVRLARGRHSCWTIV